MGKLKGVFSVIKHTAKWGLLMVQNSDANTLKESQQAKLKELQVQQAKLKDLKAELERINAKIKNDEKLSIEDTKFIGDLGWLTALSVTIASIAASL